MSGSPSCARLSRVDRPAGRAARLCSASPPCASRCRRGQAPRAAARWAASRSPQGDEMVGQRPGLVAGPGVERGDELRLVDQAGLEGEQGRRGDDETCRFDDP